MPAPAPSARRPLRAVVVLCFGGLSAALTQTLVIPIQSELPLLLHTSASNAGWVVTVTLLAAAVSMPVAGRLADLFGKQRVLATSAAILSWARSPVPCPTPWRRCGPGVRCKGWRWGSSPSASP